MKKKQKRFFIIAIIILVILSVAAVAFLKLNGKFEENNIVKKIKDNDTVEKFDNITPGVFILNDNNENYNSYINIFNTMGFKIIQGNMLKYESIKKKDVILVIPDKTAEKLESRDISRISDNISEGQNVIFSGNSKLCSSFGIKLSGSTENINKYYWSTQSQLPIEFKKPQAMNIINSNSNLSMLGYTDDGKYAAVCGRYGKGNFIYTAVPLINMNDDGEDFENFPFLMEAVNQNFNMTSKISRSNITIYTDFDFNHNPEYNKTHPLDYDGMANTLKSWGVSRVNLCAWFSGSYNGNVAKKFIDTMHKSGISVYAWFELPMVGVDFWDAHPEWREKTALGKDAKVDWRSLMALENDDCFKAVEERLKNILMSYDWDGIDMAEVYFESPDTGFKNPATFTPMSDSFIKGFEKKYNINPKDIFNPVSKYYWVKNESAKNKLISYRISVITDLHEKLFNFFNEMKKEKPYLKLWVTDIDTLFDKGIKDDIGLDINKIIALQDKYNFDLEIEDPFTLWKYGPSRYSLIGKKYNSIMKKDRKIGIDINIVNREGNVYPLSKQRGLELYELVHNASIYTSNVALYGFSTLENSDMNLVKYTYEKDVNINEKGENEFTTSADSKFSLSVDTKNKEYYIDGHLWNCFNNNGIIIPKGTHTIKVKEKSNSYDVELKDISGEILDSSVSENKFYVKYSSAGRCYITLNKKPSSIKVNGKDYNASILSKGNEYVVVLPQGENEEVEMTY